MEKGIFALQRLEIDGIDSLRHPIADANVDIIQLGRGRLTGSLTKIIFPKLAFSITDFSLPLRATGILGSTNLTICMMLGSAGRSTSWSRELQQGDVFVAAPGNNFDAVFGESSEFAALSVSPHEIAAMFAGEPVLGGASFWVENRHFTCAPHLRAEMANRVLQSASRLRNGGTISPSAADFWQRSLIEGFTAGFSCSQLERRATIPSALRLVREVEQYLHANTHGAIDVSELCTALNTSRRTLHRAFHDVLGVGPISFLRHHRLCSVHSKLCQGDPSNTHVTDVATEFGFIELGRFAH